MDNDDTVVAGRGFLLIAGAKVYFIVASALLALGLPRMLGDPGLFGQYRVVNSLISILNMVMIVATIQVVSKLVSEDEARARAVRRRSLMILLGVGGTVAGLTALGAQTIATQLFRDPALAPFIRVGAAVVFFYAIYGIFVGLLNGMKRFMEQAAVDILFSTLKVGLIVGLVLAGWGVMGVFAGFALAAAVITLVGAIVSNRKLPEATATITTNSVTELLVPILISTLMINLMLQLDMLAIKGVVAGSVVQYFESTAGQARINWLLAPLGAFGSSEMAPAFAKEASDRLAGLYGGAKNVSLLPYQATFALTFVVFPLVSKATFDEDRTRAAATVTQALRFALLVSGLLCAVLASVGEPMLAILLGPSYAAASTALVVLLIATVMASLLVLSITILNSARLERPALGVMLATVGILAALLLSLLNDTSNLREGLLLRAAISTFVAVSCGFAATQLVLKKKLQAQVPMSSIGRVIGVGLAVYWLLSLWPVSSFIVLILKAAVGCIAFAVGLFLTGEVKDSDIAAVRRILGRT